MPDMPPSEDQAPENAATLPKIRLKQLTPQVQNTLKVLRLDKLNLLNKDANSK